MLHNVNVDRLWTYWQALRPERDVFSASYKGRPRFSTKSGATITPESPLQPFFRPSGGFHTSQSVRSIAAFGYSYRGLEWWRRSKAQMRGDVARLLRPLHAPASPARKRSLARRHFARVRIDAADIERPCRVNVLVRARHAGGFVVAAGRSGVVRTGFGIDHVMDDGDTAHSIIDGRARDANATLAVEIVKASPSPPGSQKDRLR